MNRWEGLESGRTAHIDAPEFLYRLKRDDLLQEVIPVVALETYSQREVHGPRWAIRQLRTLPLAGLVNHNVHRFANGCLTLKLSLSWNTVFISWTASMLDDGTPPSGEIGMVVRSTCSDIVLSGVLFQMLGTTERKLDSKNGSDEAREPGNLVGVRGREYLR